MLGGMNRTDRLVAMVMFLQGRRVVRAEELATHFEVTVRTIYRDVSALSEAGVPVVGEAGVGYSLVQGYHLPPVMFTAEEAMAMFLGGEMVKRFSDASLTAPMDSALLKIRSVLPRERQDELDRLARATAIQGTARLAPGLAQKTLLPIQQATVGRRVLRLTYRARAKDEDTVRDVEPLGVSYHTDAWYLVAWCRLRTDFRYFKLERIRGLEVRAERFAPRPEFSLGEFLDRQMVGGDRYTARVWFTRDAAERARRETAVNVTEERPVRDGSELTVQTFALEWLAGWILSFGPAAEAVSPPRLRTLVRTLARQVAERYK